VRSGVVSERDLESAAGFGFECIVATVRFNERIAEIRHLVATPTDV
jgi:hypothetical protein